MNDFRKLGARVLFVVQGTVVVWLSQRTQLDMFTQLVLLPMILVAGLALLGLQQAGD